MKIIQKFGSASLIVLAPLFILAGCATPTPPVVENAAPIVKNITLTGAQEVPAVATAATGKANFTLFSATKYLTGSVTTTGITGTAAHIHAGAAGANGPVVIPLTGGPEKWSLPPSLILTDDQYASLMAGRMYVNVHSAANPGGEIRGQIAP